VRKLGATLNSFCFSSFSLGNFFLQIDKEDISPIRMKTILNKDYSDEQRINLLKNIIQDSIDLYNENRPGYTHD